MAVILLVLLLLLPGSSPMIGAAADEEREHTIVATSLLETKAACSGHMVAPPQNTTWVPLSLSHGSCSPWSHGSKPSLAELLRQDQLRVDDIQMRVSDDKRRMAPCEETVLNHGPVTDVKLGSPRRASSELQLSIDPAATGGGGSSLQQGVTQTVLVDTASDVPWVQCHPQTSSYDPASSATYAAFSCNSPACRGLGPYAAGCINNQCQYSVTYADGSSTAGTYSSDRLTIGRRAVSSNFQFGCSRAERGSFGGRRSSGVMGLGGGTESLVSQTAATHGNVFSYCIPKPSAKGFFVLGVPRRAASRFVVTPMLRDPRVPTFYRVLLRAITVNGQRLNVPARAAAGAMVMDSRTIVTRLPPTAYQALRAAFRNSMSMYRAAPPNGALDTCYDFTGVAAIRLPRIALVFDRNAVVELDPSGILLNSCLAFASNGNDRMAGILGNVQQQRIEVLYDVGGGAVGFRRGAC
ncbi:hypothetical protein EJB05_12769 [Eragrostis curvula]|uniref:Peptidase A1 domain-containing protein n=1 Tax=Eragrostis curvula TaxID=38414 RepID=A0A5J9VUQ1_9POAL|nr:hypothetical protein EJB05_12769 [Eragrostis curvula]